MNPTAIITADIHCPQNPEYCPRCRTDNYWQAFCKKLEWLMDLQVKYKCPIFDAGDFCNKYRLDPYVEAYLINKLKGKIFTIPGNHELPSHNINYIEKSSLNVLRAADKLSILGHSSIGYCISYIDPDFTIVGIPYGVDIHSLPKSKLRDTETSYNILMMHTPVYQTPPRSSKIKYQKSLALLKAFPEADLIYTGHNHQSFITTYMGRKLLNPGSLMRTNAEQVDYQPRVWLWYAEDNRLEPINVPITKGVVSTKHLVQQKAQEDRYAGYIEKLKDTESLKSIKYKDNLDKFFDANPDTKISVKDLVYEVRLER